jgi:DNA-binding beta-propeller fold protein YncE
MSSPGTAVRILLQVWWLIGLAVIAGCAREPEITPEAESPPPRVAQPNAYDLLLHEDRLYVALQWRDGWSVRQNGMILVVDTATDNVADTIPLSTKNPQSLAVHDGKLYVSCAGDVYGKDSGAIEVIDLATGSASILLTEEDLGGAPFRLIRQTGAVHYVRIWIEFGDTQIKRLDLSTGEIFGSLPGIQDAESLDYDEVDGELWVGNRRRDRHEAQGAVLVFDRKDELVAGPLPSPLPPSWLLRAGDPGERRTFLVASDYETAVLLTGRRDSFELAAQDVRIHHDSVLRQYQGMVYVLERYGADNIVKLDPGVEVDIVYRVHLGDRWNPVDMEFSDAEKAYISLENHAAVLIFNPQTGEVTSRIDISNLEPPSSPPPPAVATATPT